MFSFFLTLLELLLPAWNSSDRVPTRGTTKSFEGFIDIGDVVVVSVPKQKMSKVGKFPNTSPSELPIYRFSCRAYVVEEDVHLNHFYCNWKTDHTNTLRFCWISSCKAYWKKKLNFEVFSSSLLSSIHFQNESSRETQIVFVWLSAFLFQSQIIEIMVFTKRFRQCWFLTAPKKFSEWDSIKKWY